MNTQDNKDREHAIQVIQAFNEGREIRYSNSTMAHPTHAVMSKATHPGTNFNFWDMRYEILPKRVMANELTARELQSFIENLIPSAEAYNDNLICESAFIELAKRLYGNNKGNAEDD